MCEDVRTNCHARVRVPPDMFDQLFCIAGILDLAGSFTRRATAASQGTDLGGKGKLKEVSASALEEGPKQVKAGLFVGRGEGENLHRPPPADFTRRR